MREQVIKMLEASDVEMSRLTDQINPDLSDIDRQETIKSIMYCEGRMIALNQVLDLLVTESKSKTFKEDFLKSEDC